MAGRVLAGEIVFENIASLKDEQVVSIFVVSILTEVKGIGKWTAEMFLIFSLGRLDILAAEDVGLQRAMKWLYGLPEPPKAKEMVKYGENWKPFRTTASLISGRQSNRGHVLAQAPA